MKSNRNLILVAVGFLVGVLGTAAVMSHRTSTAPAVNLTADPPSSPDSQAGSGDKSDVVKLTPLAIQNSGIQVATVRYSQTREALVVPGTVEARADRVAKITPPVAGKVARMWVSIGQSVRAGQPLVTLDSTDIAQAQSAVAQARSQVRQAAARIQTAQAQVLQAKGRWQSAAIVLQRQTALAKAGAFSQSPLLTAQSEHVQAQAELLQTQADLQSRSSILGRDRKLFDAGIVSKAALEQAQTDQSEAVIRRDEAQSRVNIAQQALTRERKVSGSDLLNQQAVQSAQADVNAAQSDLYHAQTEVQQARIDLSAALDAATSAQSNLQAIAGAGSRISGDGQITLTTPVSGSITSQDATLGEAVERSTNLFSVEDLSSVTVQASVAEADVARVRVGQPVTVTVSAYPRAAFTGSVENIAADLDEKTRTLLVRCRLENPSGKLRPAMFAQVSIFTSGPDASILLPQSAIVEDGTGHVAYIASGKGFLKRWITIGASKGDKVEVLNGLSAGDRVVTVGAFVLKSEAGKSDLKDSD